MEKEKLIAAILFAAGGLVVAIVIVLVATHQGLKNTPTEDQKEGSR